MLILIITGFLGAYIGLMLLRIGRFLAESKISAATTKAYFRTIKKSNQHMLIIGDSTMYGAGIKDPENTIGGLLAKKHPGASIETLAYSGARVKDLTQQIRSARYKHYDLMLIGSGGNDIVKFSNYAKLRQNLIKFLQTADQMSDQIILCHSVNIGNIGFFLFPLNYLYDCRSRQLSQAFIEVSSKFSKVNYVNFYRPMNNDHYDKITRKKFIAGDAFHPNDYANQYFFGLLMSDLGPIKPKK